MQGDRFASLPAQQNYHLAQHFVPVNVYGSSFSSASVGLNPYDSGAASSKTEVLPPGDGKFSFQSPSSALNSNSDFDPDFSFLSRPLNLLPASSSDLGFQTDPVQVNHPPCQSKVADIDFS